MGAIPTQRETVPRAPSRAPGAPAYRGADQRADRRAVAHATLGGSPLAPGAARGLVRAALAEWAQLGLPGAASLPDRLIDDAMVVVSELVTNAVVHAGTDVELQCRLETPGEWEEPGELGGLGGLDQSEGDGREEGEGVDGVALVVEVSDHHPSRAPRDGGAELPYDIPEYGRGLRLVSVLSEAWGVTYRTGIKTVWARIPADGMMIDDDLDPCAGTQTLGQGLRVAEILAPEPQRDPRDAHDQEWLNHGALSFLAEASDLLAGQLDEDLVAALAGQLLVPRLADWCAVWLEDESMGRGSWGDGGGGGDGDGDGGYTGPGPRLVGVWHGSEDSVEELRRALEKDPPRPPDTTRTGPVTVPWPGEVLGGHGDTGSALAYRLVAGGRPLGTLVIGRAGTIRFLDEVTGLVEDLSRRVALAIGAARQYARQATISRILQRGLLPGAVAEIPGVSSALVYEPCDKGGPSGDFYDLFPAGDGRWCFAVGDVQGKGPEAAVVIGLARPWLRLLAREGYRVADVLDRLNQLLLDDATETADAAARALVAADGRPAPPVGSGGSVGSVGFADPTAQAVGRQGEGPQTRFLSLLYGELVPFDGGVRCTLASAGHPLPLVLRASGEVLTAAEPQTLLGVVEDETYTSGSFELWPGDSLLCVTDGVTERRCGPRQFDDGDGLASALAGCAGLDAQLIAERIRRLVHEFGEKPPEDDLALLVLQTG
ncbi:SpoIIE family protein phosphatase [Streptomyces sp. WI04-05B]|uniref:SpoIIE family protein phosphatase n=1 Tax=Streptomyces TaxID=1883 RepID=UPI0029A9EA61|nr:MULTISPECIES: SpoIIE family protein phosphatase [unclassified Streptomyces]MDX2548458.1 SpoIIE family protein phosphatase [Streptomyces sp. WI04-05B]MDX2585317.1 SpoIIE family protein phosphatase [Streptomyces sp. WI04-05A]